MLKFIIYEILSSLHIWWHLHEVLSIIKSSKYTEYLIYLKVERFIYFIYIDSLWYKLKDARLHLMFEPSGRAKGQGGSQT